MEITKERLEELVDIENKMQALENGGVDNWEFYGEALDKYNKARDERIAREEFRETADELFGCIEADVLENQYEPSERGAGTMTKESVTEGLIEMIIDALIEAKNKK